MATVPTEVAPVRQGGYLLGLRPIRLEPRAPSKERCLGRADLETASRLLDPESPPRAFRSEVRLNLSMGSRASRK